MRRFFCVFPRSLVFFVSWVVTPQLFLSVFQLTSVLLGASRDCPGPLPVYLETADPPVVFRSKFVLGWRKSNLIAGLISGCCGQFNHCRLKRLSRTVTDLVYCRPFEGRPGFLLKTDSGCPKFFSFFLWWRKPNLITGLHPVISPVIKLGLVIR